MKRILGLMLLAGYLVMLDVVVKGILCINGVECAFVTAALAGLSAAAGIYSAFANKGKQEEMKKRIKAREEADKARYDKEYNIDYMQLADNQAAMTLARKAAQERMDAARGRQAVMGGTDESLSETQESVNDMIADTASNIASKGVSYKMGVADRYSNAKAATDQQLNALDAQASANEAAATQGVVNAGLTVAGDLAKDSMSGGVDQQTGAAGTAEGAGAPAVDAVEPAGGAAGTIAGVPSAVGVPSAADMAEKYSAPWYKTYIEEEKRKLANGVINN